MEPILLTKDEINFKADEFLKKYHPSLTLPIPIEEIVDLKFKIDIIPIRGLKKTLQGYSLDIDGFISSDFKSISIDEYAQQNFINRYRFTLAHEIAHKELHGYFYEQFEMKNIDDWKEVINQIPDWPVRILEYQADMFAGLILVPRSLLKDELQKAKQKSEDILKAHGLEDGAAMEFAVEYLAETFQVSTGCMWNCLGRDKLKRL